MRSNPVTENEYGNKISFEPCGECIDSATVYSPRDSGEMLGPHRMCPSVQVNGREST